MCWKTHSPTGYKKKRESLYLLLVPRIEALACAHLSRTSNAEPHAVWYDN